MDAPPARDGGRALMPESQPWERLNRERAFAEGACADLIDTIRNAIARNTGRLDAGRLPDMLADAIALLTVSIGTAIGCRRRFIKMVRARLHDQHVDRFGDMLDASRRATEPKGTTDEDSAT